MAICQWTQTGIKFFDRTKLKQVGRSILLAMSATHDNIPLPKFRAIKEFDASLCPLTDCHVY